MGDGITMTWAADDRQLCALQDGISWGLDWIEERPSNRIYNSRLVALEGGPQDAHFEGLAGYPTLNFPDGLQSTMYYGFGALALDGYIYQFLTTLSDMENAGRRWIGTKLIYSADNGRNWPNQDGSTPVVWESGQRRS